MSETHRVTLDLTDPIKARKFITWAAKNNIEYAQPQFGYLVEVEFRNVFQVLSWI